MSWTDRTGDDSFLKAVAPAPEASPPVARSVGDVIADRFAIEGLAGSGGMGTVYRAFDRVTAAPVALKFVTHRENDTERFAQEARVLAELNHPAIVRYVAHGCAGYSPPPPHDRSGVAAEQALMIGLGSARIAPCSASPATDLRRQQSPSWQPGR
ncbi:MAG: protein kinase domain-containing protein [Polyangiaceae bacterium]|jgi:hypothetical protein